MTTTIDKNQWCGQFKRCNGCKLQSECMVKPEEMFPVMEEGKYVDKWAIRTTAMIARELSKQGCLMVAFIFGINNRINTALCIHSNE